MPHCQFVFLRSGVCYPILSASPRGYALRFAKATVIGSGWLLSSNEILPMPGTLGQAASLRRVVKPAPERLAKPPQDDNLPYDLTVENVC